MVSCFPWHSQNPLQKKNTLGLQNADSSLLNGWMGGNMVSLILVRFVVGGILWWRWMNQWSISQSFFGAEVRPLAMCLLVCQKKALVWTIFRLETPNIGEETPILKSIFFEWVAQPPTIFVLSDLTTIMKPSLNHNDWGFGLPHRQGAEVVLYGEVWAKIMRCTATRKTIRRSTTRWGWRDWATKTSHNQHGPFAFGMGFSVGSCLGCLG